MTTDTRTTLPEASVDEQDRRLVGAMLAITPVQRLRTVAAYWPLRRAGLERRARAGGTRRP
jgi:5-formyltetrahydrofolate cyclo-ligase